MTKRSRDDFSAQVKRTLEQRVNSRCSNPDCRVPTSGPKTEPDGASNIGKAAHIAAAAPGGPRYDSSMTPAQRGSLSNGIWLCANCADAIDRDSQRFTVAVIKRWKQQAEICAEREQGKPLPSARELDVYKAKALGEHVGPGSIGELVSEVKRMGEKEITRIDPRFSARITIQDDRTQIALLPREPVSCSLHIPKQAAKEFLQKFEALTKHGHSLEISGAGLHLEGSPIFGEPSGPSGRLVISTNARRKAVQRVAWIDVETGKPMAAEFVGEIFGGTESVTFSGALFDGLYRASYQIPLNASDGVATINTTGHMTFAPWEGKSLRRLPYLEKYHSLCKAIAAGAALASSIECEGQELCSTGSLSLMSQEDAMKMADIFGYFIRVRDVLTFFQQDATYRLGAIPSQEVTELNDLWFWLCHFSSLRGESIGTTSITATPKDTTQVDTVRAVLQKGERTTITLEQRQGDFLTLFGQTIAIGPVTSVFNQMVLTTKKKPSSIRVGQPIKVFLNPTEQSSVEVFANHKEEVSAHPLQQQT